MKNELKAAAQSNGEQTNLVDTRLFLQKIKDIQDSGKPVAETFRVEVSILQQIINKYKVKGTGTLDYNKAIKMLSMIFKAGYNPKKSEVAN